MEIYLCRHGETDWTRSGQHTSRTDLPLTGEGRRQAALLGKRLEGIGFDAVYSSPLQRSIETCHLAHFHPVVDPDLAEWDYGDFEGLTHAEILKKEPGWNIFLKGAPGGEMPLQAALRAERFLKKLAGKKGKIALFSHGHFSRVLAAVWLGIDLKIGRFLSLNVASLSILGHERSEPSIKLWNDTDYLK